MYLYKFNVCNIKIMVVTSGYSVLQYEIHGPKPGHEFYLGHAVDPPELDFENPVQLNPCLLFPIFGVGVSGTHFHPI